MEPVAEIEIAVADEPMAFTFEFDLNKVLAQVVSENHGIPLVDDDDNEAVDDDVRAAVRQALAEIEAATRPPVTDGLSATAFEIALQSAPETAADIEPAGPRSPWLPDRALRGPAQSGTPSTEQNTDTTPEPASAPAETPSTGLRRLIGGSRKP